MRLYTKNQIKVRDPQGAAAVRLDSWEDPNRTEDDDELTVYGVNSGYGMIIYNTSKTTLSFYGINETGEKKLRQPHGITAHHGGDVYVADTGNDRVVHFFNPGKELKFVRALSGLKAPRDVAMAPDRTVYVADTGNHRVAIFQNDQMVRAWGENGVLTSPSAIAVTTNNDDWSYFKDNFAIVVDQDGKRIQKFSLAGELLASWNAAEHGQPGANFTYLAIDYYSNIYVTDRAQHCLHKFDRNLHYLTSFGRRGGGSKEFNEPRGLAIYKRFGQVIIAERESVQYYWVGTDLKDFRAVRHDNPAALKVEYFLTEASYVHLEILDAEKKSIARPIEKHLRLPGPQSEWLDGNWQVFHLAGPQQPGRADHDFPPNIAPIKPGAYKIRLTIKPTYSSYKHFEKTVEAEVRF